MQEVKHLLYIHWREKANSDANGQPEKESVYREATDDMRCEANQQALATQRSPVLQYFHRLRA